MVSNYSSKTVVQLKEILRSRSLATNGVKADLISRLEESDKIDAELDEQEKNDDSVETKDPKPAAKPAEPAEPAKPVEEKPAATTNLASVPTAPKGAQQVSNDQSSEKPAEEKPKPEPKPTMTLEQLKDEAVKLLQKRITRAERFNEDDEVKSLKVMLRRIEKFGVSPESEIAQELGYKSKAQIRKEEAERKSREYLNSRKHSGKHGHRRERRRFRPYARERTRN